MMSLTDYIKQINEDGIYEGCDELAKFISEIIQDKSKNVFVIDGSKLNFTNIFFKHLLIYVNCPKVEEKLLSATYHAGTINNLILVRHLYNELFRWNEDEQIFNYVEISLETTPDREVDYSDLVHELNHTYEDWQTRKKSDNNKTFSDYVNQKYDVSRQMANSGQFSNHIVGYIEYISTGTETRAFVAQAMSKLKANLDKYSTFDEALKWQYEHNEVFKKIIEIKDLFLSSANHPIKRSPIIRAYKKIYKDTNESDEKILKRLEHKIDKFINALTKHINSILNDYAKENA